MLVGFLNCVAVLALFVALLFLDGIYRIGSFRAQYGVGVAPWIAPHMRSMLPVQFTPILGFLLITCGMPYLEDDAIPGIVRSGFRAWGRGVLLSVAAVAFLYAVAVFLLSILFMLPATDFEAGWGKALTSFARNPGAFLGISRSFTSTAGSSQAIRRPLPCCSFPARNNAEGELAVKRRASVQALRGRLRAARNLAWTGGVIHGLVGQNGGGKTVLMKCVCGLMRFEEGSIRVDGQRIGRDVETPPDLGVMIETPGFLPRMTGYRNSKILASIRGRIGWEAICQAMRTVGLVRTAASPSASIRWACASGWASRRRSWNSRPS